MKFTRREIIISFRRYNDQYGDVHGRWVIGFDKSFPVGCKAKINCPIFGGFCEYLLFGKIFNILMIL